MFYPGCKRQFLSNLGASVGFSDTGAVAGQSSLSSLLSESGFQPLNYVKVVGKRREKNMSMPNQQTISTFKTRWSQWSPKTSSSDTWYRLLSISCAPTLLAGREWDSGQQTVQRVMSLWQKQVSSRWKSWSLLVANCPF